MKTRASRRRIPTSSNTPLKRRARCAFLLFLLFPALSRANQGIVVTFHPEATQVGVRILNSGGNAFDAFVAATLVEYVVNEGGTSAAGSLGALVFDAKTHKVQYLDAEFNGLLNPSGRWDSSKAWSAADPQSGKAVLVPGAVAGLEALSKRYGRMRFADLLQPAISLARDGFRVQGFYRAGLLVWADVLTRDSSAAQTFFPNGAALKSGAILRQPELAEFLEGIARNGSASMYKGPWAAACVKAVQQRGGLMTMEDLARYQAEWREPHSIEYRGYRVFAPSGRAFGGLWALLALKTLEHTRISPLGHFSSSADALELMVRTAREALAEPWLFDYRQLDQPALVQSKLTADSTAKNWARVKAKIPAASVSPHGAHSYQIIVVDSEGNAVVGTNTHESLAWGSGVFVQGVPLNTAGRIGWATNPGERQLSPFSFHLVFQRNRLFAASGAFSSSLMEASFQFLVNLLDYELPVQDTVERPRFGTFPYDPASAMSISISGELAANAPFWLDPRVSPETVKTLASRGLHFVQTQAPGATSWVDTGLGSVAVLRESGPPEGAVTPWVQIAAPSGAVGVVAPHRQ